MKFFMLPLFLAVAVAVGAQSIRVRLASDVWPPFTNVGGEQAFAQALVDEALLRAGIGSDTKIMEFGDVVAGIRQGDFDGSAALWHSAEREAFLLFSDPYLENRLILVGRKGSDVSAARFAELAGKRIAVVGSYAYGAAVDTAEQVELVPGRNDQENLDRLLNGEVDYMLVDDLVIQFFRKYHQQEAAEFLEVGTNPLLKRSLHFAVRRDLPRAEFIVERFNRRIREMIADGTYNRILHLNWISTDADGDGQIELVLAGSQAGKYAPTNSYDVPLTDNSSMPSGPVNRYLIDGTLYQGWENVPNQFKVPQEPVNDLKPVQGFRF